MTTTVPSKVKYHISETFLSLEGEGPFIGRPMLFLRFFGCNLTCPGFGGGTPTYKSATSLETLEVSSIGCDSAYAWHPKYKNLRRTLNIDELHAEIISYLPNGNWMYSVGAKPGRHEVYNENVVFCLTGGEPLMHQPAIVNMFKDERFQEGLEILFETNGTRKWEMGKLEGGNDITVCISPKLSNSGETYKRRIQLGALKSYEEAMKEGYIQDMYLKFVTNGNQSQIDEILDLVDRWDPMYVPDIYLMPEGVTKEQTREVQTKVADLCIKQGFRYSPRLQNELWNNKVGS